MSVLANLKLVAARKKVQLSPIVQKRSKLVKRLDEQIALATAKLNGTVFTATRLRRMKDEQTGEKQTVEVEKRMKEWWWVQTDSKKVCIALKYGATVIELAKGKTAIEIASEKELVATLGLLRQAVENGELDAQIEAASSAVRAGFRK